MPNSTLTDDYRYLTSTNKEYANNRNRWQFLLDSYVGGLDYKLGGYLTRYQLETAGDYQARLETTPLDNHCQSVISTYISFLFRKEPEREFYSWAGLPDVEDFLKDCDYEGRSLDAFMKQVSIWASVFGHSWVVMTKPNIGAQTLGEQIALGVRPYVNVLSPLTVCDWTWTRGLTGKYDLTYFKYIEEVVDKISVYREWTPELVRTWECDDVNKEARLVAEEPNLLGVVPAVLVYNQRSIVKGIGVSDIQDIADVQRLIYNLTSENEQSIRMDGHPTLVVPPTAQLGSGAGAMITLQEGADPGQNPYYLEHGTSSVNNIHASIDKLVTAIDKMANTGGVRATTARTTSGVAQEVEFQLLNARLSEKADNLELAEEQLWKLFGLYQGREWIGEICYPDSFAIRDTQQEFAQLAQAKSAATSPEALEVIDFNLRKLLDDSRLVDIVDIEMMDDPETVETKTVMPNTPLGDAAQALKDQEPLPPITLA